MLEDLHDMLQKDPDAQVVANCMSVLLEVRAVPNLTACRHPAVPPSIISHHCTKATLLSHNAL